MMGGHHAASGAAAWVALTASTPIALGLYPVSEVGIMTGALVCAGAALLPDADHHSGTIAHSLPPVSEGVARGIAAVSGVLIAAAFLLMLVMEWTVGLTRRMRD